MAEARTNRRLSAILAADVVGYSRLMATDETGTLAALKRHREVVFDPAVAQHGGRIVKLIGDGTLVEFSSVVDAVKCALAIQTAVRREQTAERIITLRIGINLGDVIIEGDDIYGDGVNVAARLEPLAEPGGVCIASIVNESVGNRIEVSFKDGGEVQVKNIDRPIRVWKWHPDQNGAASGAKPPAASGTRSRPAPPSIAALPFDNMSGDAEHEYFCDGMTEDIITDLSKIAGLLVVARNSSFAYKGKKFDIRTVAKELGVRYVLEGSVRRAGNRVRITAQLIDATSGGHLWAERYDRDLTDIFAVQDDVTRQIVGALKVSLSPAENARLAQGGTSNLEAHDLYMRAREFLFGPTKNRALFDEAVSLLNRAIELDQGYAEAYAGLSMAYVLDFFNGWSGDREGALRQGRRCADQAIERDANEPFGHLVAARVALCEKDLDRARSEVEVGLSLNPNYSLAYNILGNIEIYSGQPLAAIPPIERAIRLDPAFAHQYLHYLGTAYLVAGKYETASAIFKQRILLAPETDLTRALLASALSHLGQIEEARHIWTELKAVNPKYSFEAHVGRLPFKNQADIDRIREDLARAGLPD